MLKKTENKDEKVSINEREFIQTALYEDLRIDGRGMYDFREVKISFGEDYGRVELSIGQTKVLVVVSCEIVAPYEDKPTEGFYKFDVNLTPLSSPAYDGRMSYKSIEIGRIVERGLKQSQCIDTEALCIIAGEKVWSVRIDIHVLDDYGNLIDACAMAAAAALHHFKRPDIQISDGNVKVFDPKEREPVPLSIHHLPISVTFALFESGEVVIDPQWKEEKIAKGKISITINSNQELCSIQKAGGVPLSAKELLEILKIAKIKVSELSSIIKSALEEDRKRRR